jgi:hypothetical protein
MQHRFSVIVDSVFSDAVSGVPQEIVKMFNDEGVAAPTTMKLNRAI